MSANKNSTESHLATRDEIANVTTLVDDLGKIGINTPRVQNERPPEIDFKPVEFTNIPPTTGVITPTPKRANAAHNVTN